MTTIELTFGIVALVSIFVNIYLRVSLDREVKNRVAISSDRDIFQNASASWKEIARQRNEERIKALLDLDAANAKLAKYNRKLDPKTGKIVKG